MKIRTCKQLFERIAYRKARLLKLREMNAPRSIVVMEEAILQDLVKQYERQLQFLHRCFGIKINFN